MKKLFLALFLTLTTITLTYAAAGIATPSITSLISEAANSITINAQSIPAFKGNREWSFVFSSTTNKWFEIKDIPATRVLAGQGTVKAPENCTESSDQLCSFKIVSYQLKGLTCETNYSISLRVRSIDDGTTVNSPIKTIKTKPCFTQGKPSFVKANIERGSQDDTGKLILDVNISEFPGEQTAEVSVAVGPKENFQASNFTILGSVRGTNTIKFEKEIPGVDIICGLDINSPGALRYVVKVKIGNQDFFWPEILPGTETKVGAPLLTECAPAVIDNDGGSSSVTGSDRYTLLTPLPLGEGLSSVSEVTIGGGAQNGILGILQRIFTIMLIAAVVLAVVFMIIGGARYATGDKLASVQGGREVITNAITGLLFALFAWLLLNIINPDLLRFTLTLPKIGQNLTPSATSTQSTISGEGCPADISKEECFQRIIADEERVRDILENGGISINKEACSRPDVGNCTNVGLLNETTLSRLLQVKQDCVAVNPQCEMTVTGGTEFWLHSEGGNHRKFTAVDLRIGTEPFDSFIKSKDRVQPTPNFCTEAFYYRGLRFCNERGSPSHWHVDTLGQSSGSTGNMGDLIKFENIGANNLGVWGKANGKPMSLADAKELANKARNASWYREVERVAGTEAKTLAAIIMVESRGDPNKTRTESDGRKSCGLGQILTDTAKILDRSLQNKTVEEICTKLKDPVYNIKLSYQHYTSVSGDFKKKVASYNGGEGNRGATGSSAHCSGLMRFECPWEEEGCYDATKPNEKPSNISCQVNTGYEVTRFYVDKVKKIVSQL